MNFLLRLHFFLLLAILGTGTAAAQEAEIESSASKWAQRDDGGQQTTKSGRTISNIHVTDDLLRSPEGRESLRSYVKAREAGTLRFGKGAALADTIGQQRDFNVLVSLTDSPEWSSLNFTLRATNDVANVWVETSLDGTFSNQSMEELEDFILTATPDASFQPENGIIENDNTIYGLPPDYDDDGAVDILLHDIDEGEDQDCCVLGYVTSTDINPVAGEGQGNQRDVLYVDLPDGLRNGGVTGMAGTIAHEYQHLIHFSYQHTPELTFVNEGMSEWAELMNGFPPRTITYLQNTAEHNTPLLTFRDTSPISVRENDYQRSGLFTTYIADRIGWEATGDIVAAKIPNTSLYAIGEEGYSVILDANGLTFEEIVADFHTANFVNDRSVDPRFGYSSVQRQQFAVSPTKSIDGYGQNSDSSTAAAKGGAFYYLRWTNVTDLQLDITGVLSVDGDQREHTRFHLFTVPLGGSGAVSELDPGVTEHTVSGDFSEVALVLSNVDVSSTAPEVRYTVSSDWSDLQTSFAEETVAHEEGEVSGVYSLADAGTKQASAFDVPAGGRLSAISIAPVFKNQFTNPDTGEPYLSDTLAKDVVIHVWGSNASGAPGEELYSETVDLGADASFVVRDAEDNLFYDFIELPVPELPSLPPRIFVGLSNAGTDANVIFLGVSGNASAGGASFLELDGQWYRFENIYSEDESGIRDYFLRGTVLPVRAHFLVPTADEDEIELPTEAKLEQNYPNPFNPTTSIEYSLPRTMHARLVVYNVLGREVATIVDGVQSAGEHTRRVDAAAWSSGVYFYTLETDGRSVTRQMIVLK